MEIIHKNGHKSGAFIATEHGSVIGELTYLWAGTNRFIIDHTQVIDSYKGQGIARKLVDAAVDYARQHHHTIVPQCGYVHTVFARNPDMNDVID